MLVPHPKSSRRRANILFFFFFFHPGKKEYFSLISERYMSNECLQINYGESLNKHMSKLKCSPNPLDITQIRKANDFLPHAVCYEERVCQLLKFSMSQEIKKGPFAALIIESSPNFSLIFFCLYFQKAMWFYLFTIKDSLMGKV